MKAILTFLLLIGACSPLFAEVTADDAQPQGPLLNRASDASQWVITTQLQPSSDVPKDGTGNPSSSTPVKNPMPRIMTVTKNEHLIYEQIITENGAQIETWHTSGWTVTNPDGKDWIVSVSGGNTFNSTDYSKTDFAGCNWISLNNFTGVRQVKGKRCLTFKDKVLTLDPIDIAIMRAAKSREENPANRSLNIDSLKVDVELDIDDETRLPVLLTYKTDHGTMTRSYVFKSTGDSLSLPIEVKKLLRNFQESQRRMSIPIAPI